MSNDPIALVTADWHVRKVDRAWYRRANLCGDSAFGIKQVNSLAETYGVPDVLLLGDLFDVKMQMSSALMHMRESLDRFQQNNQRVLYVQGQHEKSDPPIMHAMHSWPLHLDGYSVQLKNELRLTGLDYKPPNEVEAALKAVKDCDILATHQVWKDFMGDDRGDAWFSWANVPYIFTGDFHQTIWEERGTQHIMSPGTLNMQSIGEPADKYVFILREDMSAEKIRLHSRGYFEARINTQDDLDNFLDTWSQHPAGMPQAGVSPEIATNIIRVWYRQDLPDARDRIHARIGETAHLFTKVIPVEDTQVSVDADRRVQAVLQGGLEGCIREFYGDNQDVCHDATRLARSLDVSDELLHIFKDRLYGTDNNGEGPLQAATNGES